MRSNTFLALGALLIGVGSLPWAESFVAGPLLLEVRPFQLSRTSLRARKNKRVQQEVLTFQGDYYTSSNAISSSNKRDLVDYFESNRCRDLILSAGGTRCVSQHPLTPQLADLWSQASAHFDSPCLPETGDVLNSIDTITQFPGIKTTNTVFNAIKLIEGNTKGLPEYEILLVAEKRRVEGPRPLVWLFHKLTGCENKTTDDFSPPQSHVQARVSLVEEHHREFAFQARVEFEFVMRFPAIFLRLLPNSKRKVEKQGSAAVSKVIAQHINAVVGSLRDAFVGLPVPVH